MLAALYALAALAALSPSGDDLPGVVRSAIVVVSLAGAFTGGALALRASRRSSRLRVAAVVLDYLTAIFAGAALLNQLGVYTGFNSFADGFSGSLAVLGLAVIGAVWVNAARRLARRTGDGAAPAIVRGLELAGWGVIAIGIVWFAIGVDVVGGVWLGLQRLADPLSIILLATLVVAVYATKIALDGRYARLHGATNQQGEAIDGFLFLSPNLLGFITFFAGPLLFSLVIAFFEWDAFGGTRDFVGLGNFFEILSLDGARVDDSSAVATEILKPGYQRLMFLDLFGQKFLIGARDPLFWISLRNILFFLALALPLSVLPALALSTLLNMRLRGITVFRAVYFIPSVAGVIGITLIWKQLYNASVGYINYGITRFLDVFSFLPFIDDPENPTQIQWLSSSGTALLSIVIVFSWMTFGFNTILYLAGHQGIPGELYEAAELDGANAWHRFRYITIPSLRPTTLYVVVNTGILAMQLFDIVFVLTLPPGAPNNSTFTPVLHLYNEGFQQFRHGYASAVAWVLFALIFAFTIFQFNRQRQEADA